MNRTLIPAFALLMLALFAGFAHAQGGCCVLPDNGNGTVDMPPSCPYYGPLLIDVGIPNGTIEIAAKISNYLNAVEVAGGALGGTTALFDADILLTMTGTGSLNGFNRNIFLSVPNSEFQFATRTSGAPVQSYAGDVWRLAGQVIGDPDFDQITFQAGSTFGLPSPGQTTLTRLGAAAGDPFNVDSFFDVHYSISFIGAAGSILQNLSGTTISNGLFELCPGIAVGVAGPPMTVESTWGDVKLLFR